MKNDNVKQAIIRLSFVIESAILDEESKNQLNLFIIPNDDKIIIQKTQKFIGSFLIKLIIFIRVQAFHFNYL